MREKKRYNLNLIACTAGVKQHCRYHTAPPWPYRLCRRTTRPGPEGRQHKQLLRAPGPYFTILHYRLLLFIYLLYRLRAQRKIFIVWTGPAHHCFNPVDVVTSSSSSFFFLSISSSSSSWPETEHETKAETRNKVLQEN